MCAACTVLLSFGLSIIKASNLQRFSLPTVDSVWTLYRVWQFLTSCALVCLLNEFILLACRILWSVDVVCVVVSTGHLVKGPVCWALGALATEKHFQQSAVGQDLV